MVGKGTVIGAVWQKLGMDCDFVDWLIIQCEKFQPVPGRNQPALQLDFITAQGEKSILLGQKPLLFRLYRKPVHQILRSEAFPQGLPLGKQIIGTGIVKLGLPA